jgi:hypothetical protein
MRKRVMKRETKRETRNEKREARSEKRETRNEKRETRNEKRETRNEKRKQETRNDNKNSLTYISRSKCMPMWLWMATKNMSSCLSRFTSISSLPHFLFLFLASRFVSCFSFLVSCFSFLISRFSFLVSHFSFLVSRFSFLISHFSFLASRFSFLASHFSFLVSLLSLLHSFLISYFFYLINKYSLTCFTEVRKKKNLKNTIPVLVVTGFLAILGGVVSIAPNWEASKRQCSFSYILISYGCCAWMSFMFSFVEYFLPIVSEHAFVILAAYPPFAIVSKYYFIYC